MPKQDDPEADTSALLWTYLHPKWRWGEKVLVLLLAEGLPGPHEGPGLVGGAPMLVQAPQTLGRNAGPGGLPLEQSQGPGPRLVEDRGRLAKAHVALGRGLLLLGGAVGGLGASASHQYVGHLLVEHGLALKPGFCSSREEIRRIQEEKGVEKGDDE